MSVSLLLLNMLAWSALVWLGAALISCIGASPRIIRNVWRGAGAMMFLPLALLPFVNGRAAKTDGVLPDMVLEGGVVTLGGADIVSEVQNVALALPGLDTVLIAGLILGWAFRFGLSVYRQVRLQTIKRSAGSTEYEAEDWARALKLSRVPEVKAIESGSPFVAGVRRPVIHIPQPVLELANVEHVIVHECVHLKKGDTITRPIERLMADVFWFTPFAWLIRGQLDYWREAVVDEETSQLTGDRIGYARTLAAVARHARPVTNLPVAAFILPKEGNLKMRIKSVLDHSPRRPVATLLAALGLTLCLAPVAVSQAQSVKAPMAVAFTHPVLMEGRVSSHYGKRKHPVTKKEAYHSGIDLAVAEGTPIYTPADGVVKFSGPKDGYGEMVKIALADGRMMRFAQMLDRDVSEGDRVSAGDQIGRVGQTGAATGPHLHLEVWKPVDDEVKPVDPAGVEGLTLIAGLEIEPKVAPAAPKPPKAPKPTKEVEFNETACAAEDYKVAHSEAWEAAAAAANAENKLKGAVSNGEMEIEFDSISYPTPTYPEEAAEARKSGACDVMFDLSATGKLDVTMVECTDPIFEKSAKVAVASADFVAPTVNGKKMDVKGIQYPLLYCIE